MSIQDGPTGNPLSSADADRAPTGLAATRINRAYGKEPCPCGHRACNKWFLTGLGSFVQGSGFDEAEVDMILSALALRASADEVLGGLDWIAGQAECAMSVTAGCASTHGDPGGGLEEANRYASDIAINAQMLTDAISKALGKEA